MKVTTKETGESVAFGPNELLKASDADDVDSKHLSNYKLLDFALVNLQITDDLVDQELLI